MYLNKKGVIDIFIETRYSSDMPVIQETIIRKLAEANEALTMSDLIQRVRRDVSAEPTMNIRAAVLPLITLRRVEFTPERKLRLKGER